MAKTDHLSDLCLRLSCMTSEKIHSYPSRALPVPQSDSYCRTRDAGWYVPHESITAGSEQQTEPSALHVPGHEQDAAGATPVYRWPVPTATHAGYLCAVRRFWCGAVDFWPYICDFIHRVASPPSTLSPSLPLSSSLSLSPPLSLFLSISLSSPPSLSLSLFICLLLISTLDKFHRCVFVQWSSLI